jgi:hypothetical protein
LLGELVELRIYPLCIKALSLRYILIETYYFTPLSSYLSCS